MASHPKKKPDDDTEVSSHGRRNTLVAAISALLFVAVLGMVNSYSSPACVDMVKPRSRLSDITADQIAWIASFPPLGAMVGNAVSGYVSLKLGRRAVLMFVSVPFALSWLVIAYAPNVDAVYAGRLMCGLFAGICGVAIPAYIAEVSTVEMRGLLLAGFQVTFAFGVVITMVLGAVVSWAWLAVAGATTVAISAAMMCAMPESPHWLARKSRHAEAVRALIFFRGSPGEAARELQEILDHAKAEPERGLTLRELLEPTLYKPVLIAVCLSLFQQFSGVSALMSYSVELLQNTESFLNASLAAIVVAVVQLVAAALSSGLMDRVGRRVLYIVSGACMTLSLVFLGVHALVSHGSQVSTWSWVPLFCLVIYIASFALGFGSIVFVVVPEMVPTHSRSFLLAVASVSISFFGFLATKTFDGLRKTLGMAYLYWVYAAFTLVGFLFYLIFVPETKGKTIHDINRSFSNIEQCESSDNPDFYRPRNLSALAIPELTRTGLRKTLGMAYLYWVYAAFTLLGFLFYLIFVPETKGKTIHDINRSFSNIEECESSDNPDFYRPRNSSALGGH